MEWTGREQDHGVNRGDANAIETGVMQKTWYLHWTKVKIIVKIKTIVGNQADL